METTFCPATLPDYPKATATRSTALALARPFLDKTIDAAATLYIPGYGLYKISRLAFNIIKASQESKLSLIEACATPLYPKNYITAKILTQLGIELPKKILFDSGPVALASQIFCVTITDSLFPKTCIDGIKQLCRQTMKTPKETSSEIAGDYILIEVAPEEPSTTEDDFVIL